MKQFFGPLFDPVGAVWLVLLLGTVLFSRRRQWKAAAWLGCPALLLFLFGSTRLTDRLIAAAERPYADATAWPASFGEQGSPDAIIILGGGSYVSAHDAFGFALGHAGSRLLAGLELARELRPKMLVMGGGAALVNEPEHASGLLLQHWAEAWHLSGVTITNLGICADTHAEALQCRKLSDQLGWKKIVLVTSALHMDRSRAVFRKAGLEVMPRACDFQAAGVSGRFPGLSPFPRQERLLILSFYLHEKIGWLVYLWRGWV